MASGLTPEEEAELAADSAPQGLTPEEAAELAGGSVGIPASKEEVVQMAAGVPGVKEVRYKPPTAPARPLATSVPVREPGPPDAGPMLYTVGRAGLSHEPTREEKIRKQLEAQLVGRRPAGYGVGETVSAELANLLAGGAMPQVTAGVEALGQKPGQRFAHYQKRVPELREALAESAADNPATAGVVGGLGGAATLLHPGSLAAKASVAGGLGAVRGILGSETFTQGAPNPLEVAKAAALQGGIGAASAAAPALPKVGPFVPAAMSAASLAPMVTGVDVPGIAETPEQKQALAAGGLTGLATGLAGQGLKAAFNEPKAAKRAALRLEEYSAKPEEGALVSAQKALEKDLQERLAAARRKQPTPATQKEIESIVEKINDIRASEPRVAQRAAEAVHQRAGTEYVLGTYNDPNMDPFHRGLIMQAPEERGRVFGDYAGEAKSLPELVKAKTAASMEEKLKPYEKRLAKAIASASEPPKPVEPFQTPDPAREAALLAKAKASQAHELSKPLEGAGRTLRTPEEAASIVREKNRKAVLRQAAAKLKAERLDSTTIRALKEAIAAATSPARAALEATGLRERPPEALEKAAVLAKLAELKAGDRAKASQKLGQAGLAGMPMGAAQTSARDADIIQRWLDEQAKKEGK